MTDAPPVTTRTPEAGAVCHRCRQPAISEFVVADPPREFFSPVCLNEECASDAVRVLLDVHRWQTGKGLA